jgi:hypothetical protein
MLMLSMSVRVGKTDMGLNCMGNDCFMFMA